MPSLQTARRVANAKNNGAKTIGQIYKEQSDWAMEQTFENDIATKTCYIYDHFHDDFFTDEHGITRSLAEGMTYENTNKTKIDAKFIVKSYQSMDKDQVEYYLMFRPSQPVRFNEGDELYYYETDFRKRYGATFPIGLFVDVPDDRGIYHKWIICRDEPANQFPKYLILPVNYELTWIEQPAPAPIPIVGISRILVTYSASFAGTHSSTTAKAPASCTARASFTRQEKTSQVFGW